MTKENKRNERKIPLVVGQANPVFLRHYQNQSGFLKKRRPQKIYTITSDILVNMFLQEQDKQYFFFIELIQDLSLFIAPTSKARIRLRVCSRVAFSLTFVYEQFLTQKALESGSKGVQEVETSFRIPW